MKLDAYDDEGRYVGEVDAVPDDTKSDLLIKLSAYRFQWLGLDSLPLGTIRFMIHDTHNERQA